MEAPAYTPEEAVALAQEVPVSGRPLPTDAGYEVSPGEICVVDTPAGLLIAPPGPLDTKYPVFWAVSSEQRSPRHRGRFRFVTHLAHLPPREDNNPNIPAMVMWSPPFGPKSTRQRHDAQRVLIGQIIYECQKASQFNPLK